MHGAYALNVPIRHAEINPSLSVRFAFAVRELPSRADMPEGRTMPKNIAQWTGLTVTAVVVLGCDTSVFYAMPLGIFAGALATFFVSVAESNMAARAVPQMVNIKR
jgi:hypothetical protein